MFKTIFLSDQYFPEYSSNETNSIDELSKLNILIGSNNSGKSRFLRRLFSEEGYSYNTTFFDFNHFNKELENFDREGKGLHEYDHLRTMLASRLSNYRIKNLNASTDFTKFQKYLQELENSSSSVASKHLLVKYAYLFGKMIENYEQNKIWERYYIPVLRGLRPIQTDGVDRFVNSADNYNLRCLKDYFPKVRKERLFTGLHLYQETQSLLLGTTEERGNIREFEKFLSEKFFQDKDVNIVPRLTSDVLYVKIGDDEFPIYDLGDGIQSIIILTYPLFFNRGKNAIFYFEEPEVHLHPGLQRVFIETLLLPQFSNFQYFLTTHSNHFLDLTLDYDKISVYHFTKADESKKSFKIERVNSPKSRVLEELGVRNSSVFLSNCTIWVEGITDRLYLRKYLALYQQTHGHSFKEDLHYSFVEYGGNNITHWSFLDNDDAEHSNINVERLCGRLFLISDKDNAGLKKDGDKSLNKSKKVERHEKLQEKLGDRYYCLNVVEIENLLTKDVIKDVVKSYSGDGVVLDFRTFDKGQHENEKLGGYIEKSVVGLSRKFSAESKTITDKVGFCKRALQFVDSYEKMSDEAKIIASKLYHFIKANNK